MRTNGLVVAIDGPSGAGKSTAGRALAAQLGYTYIDTGAMYRALALKASRAGVSLDAEEALAALCRASSIQLTEGGRRVLLDGYDVTADIRSREISRASSLVSVHPGVRVEMVERQREMGKDGGVVLDGRDIGTAVFPDAEVKFFLDANPGERAQRRLGELRAAGNDVTFDAIEREVRERDYTDSHRAESPLTRAWDAIALDTTKLGPDEVVERMLAAVRAREGRPVDLGRLAEAHRRSPRRYLEALRTGGLSAGLYRVVRGTEGDQRPHGEEEAYLVLEGRGRFRMGDEDFAVEPGHLFAVPARVEHGFHSITEDLLMLVFFAPPEGAGAQATE
jgi:cytidylate kinase